MPKPDHKSKDEKVTQSPATFVFENGSISGGLFVMDSSKGGTVEMRNVTATNIKLKTCEGAKVSMRDCKVSSSIFHVFGGKGPMMFSQKHLKGAFVTNDPELAPKEDKNAPGSK